MAALMAGLALGATGCGAVDQALTDGGDAALIEDASERTPRTEPVKYRSRPVEFLVGLASTNGVGSTLVSPGGVCGFLGDGSWRAVVGGTEFLNTVEDFGSPWVSIEIIGDVPHGSPANREDATAAVRGPTPAVARLADRDTGVPVEYPGLLRVQPSGLVASFTADPDASGAGEGSSRPTDFVVQVECETRPEESG